MKHVARGGVSLAACLLAALATLCVATGPPRVNAAQTPAPWWGLTAGARPTALPRGGEGQVVLTAENLGDTTTSGQATIAARLPEGLHATGIEAAVEGAGSEGAASCALESLTCTTNQQVAPYNVIEVQIAVRVEDPAPSAQVSATVSGGGAVRKVSAAKPIEVGAPERFGIESYSLRPEAPDGSVETHAGSHPFQVTSVVTLNTVVDAEGGIRPVAAPRALASQLPAGLIADPAGFEKCSQQQLLSTAGCPAPSAVGVASLTVRWLNGGAGDEVTTLTVPIYNLEPAPGQLASFGIVALRAVLLLDAVVRPGGGYGVTISARNITQIAEPVALSMTFWGVPGAPLHDEQRGQACLESNESCPPPAVRSLTPFLTMPTSCGPFESTATATSWAAPLRPSEEAAFVTYRLPESLHGCESVPFTPTIALGPPVAAASSSTGLSLDIHIPQEAGATPEGVVESPLRNLTLALPEGVALNPAATSWLEGCTESQIGFLEAQASGAEMFTPTKPEPFCPGASKVGNVIIRSPLLSHPLEGGIYLATPTDNPFRSLVSLYAFAEAPEAGIVVKLAGELLLNPDDGRVTVLFKDLPQLPFQELSFELSEGPRAPLMTPSRCGTYAATAMFTPWSGSAAVTLPASVKVASGPGGAPCAGTLPFKPSLQAGMESNQAGSPSALTAQLTRQDGEQILGGLTIVTPPGLAPDLAGVTPCEEPQAARGDCGSGALIGTVALALGAGPQPAWIGLPGGGATGSPTGSGSPVDPVYLTGPYDGSGPCTPGAPGCAPFGLAIVIHPVAGPFDLSEGGAPIVVRARVEVDPRTAQLRIVTGSLPTILKGVPLAIKQLNLNIDRSGFLLNPTSCEAMSIDGSVNSAEGASAPVSSRYQAAGCSGLAFKPKLVAKTAGNGRLEGAGAELRLTVSGQAGGANLRKLRIVLPKRLVARLPTIQRACKGGAFKSDPASCPKASRVGDVAVNTPLLPLPSHPSGVHGAVRQAEASMRGFAYLVAKEGAAARRDGFPNLVLVLDGDGVRIDLTGAVFVSAKNVTSVTFKGLPDIPMRRLVLSLPEGKRSLLAAGGSLCKRRGRLKVGVTAAGQNGAVLKRRVKVAVSGCKGRARGGAHGKRRGAKRHHGRHAARRRG